MNRKQFFDWMNDPSALNEDSAADLQQLVQEYPYFQTARLLYLINLNIIQDYRYESELKNAAAYLIDRARLKEWVSLIEKTGDVKSFHHDDTHLKKIEEKIRENLRDIEMKKSRLRELLEEKKALTGGLDENFDIPTEENAAPSLRPLPKDELLEEYIRQQNELSSTSVNFYSPEDSARKSIEENDHVISETLARLIAAQGKKEKAMEIYQKLMLKYPQKSSYFAAQIEKLRKES